MTRNFIIHRTIAFAINMLVAGLIVYFVTKTNSDKAPLIFLFYYPVLWMANLIVLIILSLVKSAHAVIYKYTLLGLLILVLPLLYIISNY